MMISRILAAALIIGTLLGARSYTTATVVLQVAPNGDDSNDGITAPLATIDRCAAILQQYYDSPGMVCQLAHGEYDNKPTSCMGEPVGTPLIWINGDSNNSAVLLSSSSIAARDSCKFSVQGVTLLNSTLLADQMGVIDFSNVAFADCTGCAQTQVNDGGYENGWDFSIIGNAPMFANINHGGTITISGANDLPHLLGFSEFVYNIAGHFRADAATWTGMGAGTGTSGAQYYLDGCGDMTLGGAVLPGTSPGSVAAGGCGRVF